MQHAKGVACMSRCSLLKVWLEMSVVSLDQSKEQVNFDAWPFQPLTDISNSKA